MNLSRMSTEDLLDFIKKATDELKLRINRSTRDRIVEDAKYQLDLILKTINPELFDIKFHINRDKKVVVAVIEYRGKVAVRGIARCYVDDCFNVYIGKIIALCRALNREIDERFLNLPQPTTIQVGDIVSQKFPNGTTYKVDTTQNMKENCTIVSCKGFPDMVGRKANGGDYHWAKVVDDSRE